MLAALSRHADGHGSHVLARHCEIQWLCSNIRQPYIPSFCLKQFLGTFVSNQEAPC
jgi:hypothetical protein